MSEGKHLDDIIIELQQREVEALERIADSLEKLCGCVSETDVYGTRFQTAAHNQQSLYD